MKDLTCDFCGQPRVIPLDDGSEVSVPFRSYEGRYLHCGNYRTKGTIVELNCDQQYFRSDQYKQDIIKGSGGRLGLMPTRERAIADPAEQDALLEASR